MNRLQYGDELGSIRVGMIKKILIGVAILLVVFVVVVAMQPSAYRVVRSATMAAPAADVFAHVNDFHQWEAWSPWAKLDPAIKNSFDGAPSGTGATFAWVGNDKVGEGRMTILESRPSEQIRINLEFIKPFPSACITEFNFKPEGDQTAVTWTMAGNNNFLAKAVCLFMNMDKMVGGDFERGLTQMKAIVETPAKPKPEAASSDH